MSWDEKTIGVSIGAATAVFAGVWKIVEMVREKIKRKREGSVVLHLSKSDLIQVLREHSDFTQKIFEKSASIKQKQKFDCKNQSRKIETELTKRFNLLVDKNSLERDLKTEYKNAVECVMINMRVDFYEKLEINHFAERDNWGQFVNDQEEVLFNKVINNLNEAFPKYIVLDGYLECMSGMREFIKNAIECMFNQARETSIKINSEIEDLKHDQDQIIDRIQVEHNE